MIHGVESRGDDGGDNEGDHYSVLATVGEHLWGDHPNLGQEKDNERCFEDSPRAKRSVVTNDM